MTTKEIEDQPLIDSSWYAIEIKDLVKQYTGRMEVVKAVDTISFKVRQGEFFGLLGPNGAGKSTLIGMMTGMSRPTAGEIRIAGYDLSTDKARIKSLLAVCPQEPAIYKFMSGLANIKFFGSLYLMTNQQIEERANELLEMLGLFEFRNRLARNYSGGMIRQLSLIIALISDPAILFLDEPTVGMDPRNRRKVWDFLQQAKGYEKTMILTTHYIEEAEALCDRVAIIDYGQLLELGTPAELISKYGVDNLEQVFMEITGRSILEGVY